MSSESSSKTGKFGCTMWENFPVSKAFDCADHFKNGDRSREMNAFGLLNDNNLNVPVVGKEGGMMWQK